MITDFLVKLDDVYLGIPLVIFILGVGILLTIRLRGLQFTKLNRAFRYMFSKEKSGKGEVSSFGALCTALSATIGTGNIVGVATAIVAGGPGALFWMWIAAFFGMATKYAEGVLAIKYRVIKDNDHVIGGPFYYIENGMGKKWKWLGKVFAFFGAGVGLLGIGTFTQVNGIANSVNSLFDKNNKWTVKILGNSYSWTIIITGIVVTVLVALVIIGGIKRITSVSEIIVPFMAATYIIACLVILLNNYDKIPNALCTIISSAFGIRAAAGGALGAIVMAMQKGITRGIFSNEAGLGSAPIAAAAAKTYEPVRQGLVSMTGTFIDTIVICTMTGLAIVITNSWDIGLEGVDVTTNAFKIGLPYGNSIGAWILLLCLIFFAFTTILGWNYYGERCLEYLANGNLKCVRVYRYLYILAVFIGPFMTVQAVWTIADIFNILMAIPNLIAIIALSGIVVAETSNFFKVYRK